MVIDRSEARTIMRILDKRYIDSLSEDAGPGEDIRLLKNRILEFYPDIRCPSCGRDNTGISSHTCL